MTLRILNPEQVAELLRNPNVSSCSSKSITYSPAFKVRAVNQQQEAGFTAVEIFREAGFDPEVIGRKNPHDRLKRWNRIVKRKGFTTLAKDSRGMTKGSNIGRPRTEELTDAQKIERLQATVAYLKAENHFLIRLRSGKAE
jgi:transposase